MVLDGIKNFAVQTWQISDEDLTNFKITKVDATIDLCGAFIPDCMTDTQEHIKKRLSDLITQLIADKRICFHSAVHQ